jgi:HJR/Mrr/RecB family endonuclease
MAGPGRPRKSTAIAKPTKVYDSEIVAEAEVDIPRLPRARTPEAREAQLAALAYDLAEAQFHAGTASSQVIVHFLKVGSTREKQELEKMKQETILVEAKVKDLANVEEMKKLYLDAMDAMRGYAGQDVGEMDDPNIF